MERVVVRDGGVITAGCQLLVRRTPVGRLAQVLRGPLVAGSSPRAMDAVVAAIGSHAKRHSLASVRVELFPTQCGARDALIDAGYAESDDWGEASERPSLVVPLDHSDEQLLAAMKKRGRYNINLAKRSGVEVEAGGVESIHEFYALYRATAAFQGFPAFPMAYFGALWRTFGAVGRLHLFLARFRGVAIASIIDVEVGRRMYYTWGGMDRSPEHAPLCANYLLHFAAMQRARERSCTHYDLSGVSDFKERIGLDRITWPRPLNRWFGSMREVRRSALRAAWRSKRARRAVFAISGRLGFLDRMPW